MNLIDERYGHIITLILYENYNCISMACYEMERLKTINTHIYVGRVYGLPDGLQLSALIQG